MLEFDKYKKKKIHLRGLSNKKPMDIDKNALDSDVSLPNYHNSLTFPMHTTNNSLSFEIKTDLHAKPPKTRAPTKSLLARQQFLQDLNESSDTERSNTLLSPGREFFTEKNVRKKVVKFVKMKS